MAENAEILVYEQGIKELATKLWSKVCPPLAMDDVDKFIDSFPLYPFTPSPLLSQFDVEFFLHL